MNTCTDLQYKSPNSILFVCLGGWQGESDRLNWKPLQIVAEYYIFHKFSLTSKNIFTAPTFKDFKKEGWGKPEIILQKKNSSKNELLTLGPLL